MLVPDKDPHIISAEKLLAEADKAAEAHDYGRVTALSALAQAHIAVSRHSEAIEGDAEVIEKLTDLCEILTAQIPT